MSEEISKVVKQQISACPILPREDKKQNKPTIVVQFANRKREAEVLRRSKKLKGACEWAPDEKKCWNS